MTASSQAREPRRLSLALSRRSLPLWAVLALLAVVYARTLAPSITWANSGADSGDLVTAAAVLGVAHPTGYPTYLLLARAFQLLPVGDLAFRTNLLSLAAALAAVWLTGCTVATLCAGTPWAPWSAALAGLALGLSPLCWSQAVIAEVHTLNTLFAAALVRFALDEGGPATVPWGERCRGAIAGLALGNHITIGGLVLVWLAAAAAGSPRGRRFGAIARRLAWVGVGLLVYLYLPLRAAAQPAVNWGGASSLPGLWWVVSGAPYRNLVFAVSDTLMVDRARAWAALLIQQFGLVGLMFGVVGALYSRALRPRDRLVGAVVIAGYSLFALLYDTADSFAYLLPAYVIFAIWIGCGANHALQLAGRLPAVAACMLVACAALLAAPTATTFRQVDASQDRRAIDFAADVLAATPQRAILLTTGDTDTFALWYAHFALKQRPDIAVVVDSLLDFPWYRTNLRTTYPWLRIPDALPESWPAELAAANTAHPVCTIISTVPGRLTCDAD